jgi:dihydrofolate synthase/folylpolyglutamate synthase
LGLTGLSSPLVGRHQLNNHAVALAACRERLRRSHRAAPSAQAWREAIAVVNWPGRLERIDPRVVIDVGHTPEGVAAALEGYRRLEAGSSLLVTGVSANKDAFGVMKMLAPGFEHILVTAAHHNGKHPDETARLVKELNLGANVSVAADIAQAVEQARAQDRPIYVAGGLFLAAEFAAAWRGEDPAALRFF